MKKMGGMARGQNQQYKSLGMPQRPAQIAIHLSEHVDYPASKREIVSACSSLTCFSYEQDREWLEESLENRSFKDSDDVEDSLQLI